MNIIDINFFTDWIYSKKYLKVVNKKELLRDFNQKFKTSHLNKDELGVYEFFLKLVKNDEDLVNIKHLHLCILNYYTLKTNVIIINSIYDD